MTNTNHSPPGLRPPPLLRLARAAAKVRADLPLALLDALMVAAAYTGVLVLRFDGAVPGRYWGAFGAFLATAVAVHLGANAVAGLYGKVWRHASVDEARRVLVAGALAVGVLGWAFLRGAERELPASVVILGAALVVLLVGMLRFHSRLFAFRRRESEPAVTHVAVLGAGDAGNAVVRDMLREPASGLRPVALLDDDPRKQGRSLAQVPVIGGIDALRVAVDHFGAQQALLAIPSADSALVRRVAALADAAGIPLKVLPSVSELVSGNVTARDARDLSIDDLLGRQQVATDLDAVCAQLAGRRVLITGAGGSIGAEIARQVAACAPARLVLVDHDETHLHDAAAGLGHDEDTGPDLVLADIRDAELVDRLFAVHAPEVVFHAAAHKHVPLLEAHPCEAVATNVLGTANVVDAAARHDVGRFVFISTDKAVNPASVMGASKRLGEQLLLWRAPAGAAWCAVRFGNVLGSRGSVIPTFVRQIQAGGPVTVTHPDVTRYFMSVQEAVQLVLQAAVYADGGDVFMLDMGEPIRIIDLAERMIRLSGRRVGADVPIRITGLRPGEKLAEDLRGDDEHPTATAHPAIQRLHPGLIDGHLLTEYLTALAVAAAVRDDAQAATLLHDLVAARPAPVRLREGERDRTVVRLRDDNGNGDGVRLRAGDRDRTVVQRRRNARDRHPSLSHPERKP